MSRLADPTLARGEFMFQPTLMARASVAAPKS